MLLRLQLIGIFQRITLIDILCFHFKNLILKNEEKKTTSHFVKSEWMKRVEELAQICSQIQGKQLSSATHYTTALTINLDI